MVHKFNIGQIVELGPGMLRSSAPGPYEIRHLVPALDRDPDDPRYRIKSIAEKHERVPPESELMLSGRERTKVRWRQHACLAEPPVTALKIQHQTIYRFRQPVSLGTHRLMLRPREGRDLRLMSHTLAITPVPVLNWVHDVFGNAVAMATVATDRHARDR